MTALPGKLAAPVALLAELTHRCPLGCPYCSNPLALDPREDELDTSVWKQVFSQAAALGVLHAHLSGGEPAARHDLAELVAHCAKAGLYTNLITSGIGLTQDRIKELARAGLDHAQLSIQDSDAPSADRIAGYKGAFARKQAVAEWITQAGLPLTVNAVIHRANIFRAGDMVRLAVALGARRVEIAHTQYYGWGLLNRAALMPSRAQAEAAIAEVEALKTDACRGHRHRPCDPRLSRPLSEGLHGRVGQTRVEYYPLGQSAALPRGGNHSGSRISGMCAIIRSRTSGQIRPLSMRSGGRIGCASLAAPARARRSIMAAAAARRLR